MAASTIWVDALDALWAAIDQKSELAADGETPIHRKYKFETNSDCLPGVTPSYSDLNAISVWPTSISTEDYDHRTKKFPISFTVNIWTRDWVLRPALKTWMNVLTAIMEERDENLYPDENQKINTYLKMATGLYPELASFNFFREAAGENGQDGRAIRAECRVIVGTSKDIYPR